MNDNVLNAFNYAIETANTEMFDSLIKEFETGDQEDRDLIVIRTVVHATDIFFIQYVMDRGHYNIDWKNNDGNSFMHYAAMSDNPETIRFFLKKGLDVNACGYDNQIPIYYAACYTANVDVVKTLLEAGADINWKDSDGKSLLTLAAGRNPNPEIIEYFLERGLDIEERDNEGFTPVLYAAFCQSNEDVITSLVKAEADIGATTNNGKNMLHYAAFNDNPNIARYLFGEFPTWVVDNSGFSCLREALLNSSSPEVIKLFLHSMKIELFHHACYNSTPGIIEALIQSGYDVNSTDSRGISSIMEVAYNNTNPDIIKLLLYYNAIWNSTDKNGRNPLHFAAANTDPSIYNWMVRNPKFEELADKKDYMGNTPAYYREHPNEF